MTRRTPYTRHACLAGLCLLLLVLAPGRAPRAGAQGQTFYVAVTGSNSADGSQARPWATVSHAVASVPDGSTILVQPGTYNGEVRLDRAFNAGIVVRSATPYAARLRSASGTQAVRSYYGRRITLEGFDIAHGAPDSRALVVHIQDANQNGTTREITLRNNIIHDSVDNDLLKINNAARQVTVTGNLFSNQKGSDEHIDINSVTDVIVQDNIFLNTPANGDGTSAFIVVKDSNGDSDGITGSERVTLRRNIFLGWAGSVGHGFIQVGEDGAGFFEARELLIENNLMLHHSAATMNAPIAVMGSAAITFRNNTFVGDGPAQAWLRVYRYGANPLPTDVRFFNNIWARPGGGQPRFSRSPQGQVGGFALVRNLYWNGGQAIPSSASEVINLDDDPRALVANPGLPAHSGLVPPTWDSASARFADGSTSIGAAFGRLANYGALGTSSPARGAADPANAPADDLLGRPRGSSPDLGALQGALAPPPTVPLEPAAFLPLLRR
jgi:hypothetical protein